MKKLLFLAAVLTGMAAVAENASAQNITIQNDTSIVVVDQEGVSVMDIETEEDNNYRFRVAGYEISVGETPYHKSYTHDHNRNNFSMGLGIGFSTLVNKDYSAYAGEGDFLDLNVGKSIEVNWGLASLYFGFGNHFGISSGIHLIWNNYVFSEAVTLEKVNGVLQPLAITSDGYTKSKLTTFGIQVPLSFRCRITDWISFSAGVYGQVNLSSYTKVKYPVDKHYNMYVNPYSYGFLASMNFGLVSIYATYSMTPLFKEGKGPGANSLTFGFSFGIY